MLAGLLRQIGARLRGNPVASATQLALAGRHREAERLLRRHLSRRPQDAKALHALGLVCHETRRSSCSASRCRPASASWVADATGLPRRRAPIWRSSPAST